MKTKIHRHKEIDIDSIKGAGNTIKPYKLEQKDIDNAKADIDAKIDSTINKEIPEVDETGDVLSRIAKALDIKSGFYEMRLMNNATLKKFYKDAIMLSYDTHIEKLDCNKSFTRQRTKDKTLQDMINMISIYNHNVCIDRSIQHPTDNNQYGEIGYCSLKNPDYLFYIFVTLDNLKLLVDKYKLEMK